MKPSASSSAASRSRHFCPLVLRPGGRWVLPQDNSPWADMLLSAGIRLGCVLPLPSPVVDATGWRCCDILFFFAWHQSHTVTSHHLYITCGVELANYLRHVILDIYPMQLGPYSYVGVPR